MASLTRWFDRLVVLFFIAHIPTTLFFDSQADEKTDGNLIERTVLPAHWYPDWAIQTSNNYIRDFGDPLVRDMPPWFKCLVWMEVALQLPFFFVGTYAFALRRNWIRTPALLYGINVASTMVPILGELALSPRTDFNRPALLAIYAPFMLVPAGIAIRMAGSSKPFGSGGRRRGKSL